MALMDMFKGNKSQLKTSFEDELQKTVKPIITDPSLDEKINTDKGVFNLSSEIYNVDNLILKAGGRLSDEEQRRLAQYDSIISLIITTRATQFHAFGHPAKNKYDRGFMLRETMAVLNDPTIPKEDREAECLFRTKMSEIITKWIVNCGTSDPNVINHIFKKSDSFFKYCTLGDYLEAQGRNLLNFGRAITQVIRNKQGVPLCWRPLPAETIYRVIDGRPVTMSHPGQGDSDVNVDACDDVIEYNKLNKKQKPVAFVQRIKGKNVSFFTEDEIKITYWQKQAYEGLNGYPLSPIELAYYSILMNFYSQRYLENAFTRGLGSKGIILLKTPEGEIPPQEQIDSFRKMFNNYLTRNDNSATIPVIAGPMDIDFVQLMATPKDTEFDKLYARVLQTLCGAFQISPHEIAFGSLDPENSTVSDGVKQDSIVQGEERGLKHVLEKLFAEVMSIVFEAFEQAKPIFTMEAIGLGQNTKEADLGIYREALQTNATFGRIWADSERSESFPFGANVPTSPIFHQSVGKYMKYSEMRHYFFHDEGALDNPAYDFICDPSLDATYQQLKTGTLAEQAKQMKIQTDQLEQQGKMQADQMQQQQEQPQQAGQEIEKAQERDDDLHQQELKHNEDKHKQKMEHSNRQNALNLRLRYQQAMDNKEKAAF
jgi:hypothetical protein